MTIKGCDANVDVCSKNSAILFLFVHSWLAYTERFVLDVVSIILSLVIAGGFLSLPTLEAPYRKYIQ